MEDDCADLQWVCDSVCALRRKKTLLCKEIAILNHDVNSDGDEKYYKSVQVLSHVNSLLRAFERLRVTLSESENPAQQVGDRPVTKAH
jgi:hypothetical protein